MQVKFIKKGTTLVVSIMGEMDHHSAEYVRQKIDSEIIKSSTKNVVFDFSKVSFMDSSGIGVIVGRYKNVQKINGKTLMSNVDTQMKKIFEMSGLLKIIPVFDDIDMAIRSLEA